MAMGHGCLLFSALLLLLKIFCAARINASAVGILGRIIDGRRQYKEEEESKIGLDGGGGDDSFVLS